MAIEESEAEAKAKSITEFMKTEFPNTKYRIPHDMRNCVCVSKRKGDIIIKFKFDEAFSIVSVMGRLTAWKVSLHELITTYLD